MKDSKDRVHEKSQPAQFTGAESRTSETITLPDIGRAKERYKIAYHRLLDVSRWHQVVKGVSAEFELRILQGIGCVGWRKRETFLGLISLHPVILPATVTIGYMLKT